MNKRRVSASDLIPLIEQALNHGGSFHLPVRGQSMWPFLIGDKSVVELRAVNTLHTGRIYLFKDGDKLFLHRLIKINGDRLVFRGDALTKKESTTKDTLVGEAVRIKRKKRWKRPTGFIHKTAYTFWRGLGPLRPRVRNLCLRLKGNTNGKHGSHVL